MSNNKRPFDRLVALCGNPGVGKDTVADLLVKEYGFSKVSFADPLYEAASAEIGIPVAVLRDQAFKNKWSNLVNPKIKSDVPFVKRMAYAAKLKGKSPREFVKEFSIRTKDKKGKYVFFEQTIQRITSLRLAGIYSIVVADLRHPYEYEAMKNRGAATFRITDPEVDKPIYEKAQKSPEKLHSTEAWLIGHARTDSRIEVVPNTARDNGRSAVDRLLLFLTQQAKKNR